MTGDYERHNFWNSELEEFLKEEKRKKSISSYNKEIDKAVSEVRGGKFISHEQVAKDMKNW